MHREPPCARHNQFSFRRSASVSGCYYCLLCGINGRQVYSTFLPEFVIARTFFVHGSALRRSQLPNFQPEGIQKPLSNRRLLIRMARRNIPTVLAWRDVDQLSRRRRGWRGRSCACYLAGCRPLAGGSNFVAQFGHGPQPVLELLAASDEIVHHERQCSLLRKRANEIDCCGRCRNKKRVAFLCGQPTGFDRRPIIDCIGYRKRLGSSHIRLHRDVGFRSLVLTAQNERGLAAERLKNGGQSGRTISRRFAFGNLPIAFDRTAAFAESGMPCVGAPAGASLSARS